MKKAIVVTTLTALMSTTANADAIGLYIGAQYWVNKTTGSFGEPGKLENFSFEDQKQGSYHIAFEHPLPLLPNVKLAQTTLDTTGTTTLSQEIEFGGVTLPEGTSASTDFGFAYTDYTFYYEVFSNDLFAFDFGLTGRDIRGDIKVSGGGETGQVKGSEIIPLLYASTVIGLPFTGFKVYGQGNFLSVDKHTVYDYDIGVSYAVLDNIAVDLDVQLGYRSVHMQLEDISKLSTDMKFDGAYLGAVVHF